MKNTHVSSLLVALLFLELLPIIKTQKELELYEQFNIHVALENDWINELNNRLAQCNYGNSLQHSSTNSLFVHYPALKEKLPYVSLATLPTPVLKLKRISTKLGVDVYIKRDDLTGGVDSQGVSLYGGNKVRKLEFLLGQACALGAKKVMTFGCVGSNHAVATVVHAHRLGMHTICMLKHQPPSHVVQRNLLMQLKYKSELHYNANNTIRNLNAFIVWLEHYKKDGQVPYIIPTGGSTVLGSIGFVNAVFELVEQIKQGMMPKPSYIYVPCGSCATAAGLLLGCKASGLDSQIVAVAVEPDEIPGFAQTIGSLFIETNKFLRALDSSFPECSYTDKDLRVDFNFTGPEYGIFTTEGMQAQNFLLDEENISLEGTYTAKAFASLLHDAKQPKGGVVLFWNTYCGLDFSTHLKGIDYRKLPQCFHYYFDEKNIQPLDQSRSMCR